MKLIRKLVPILALSVISAAFAAPNYKACNMCQMQAQTNPRMSCDDACKDIGLSDLIPGVRAKEEAAKAAEPAKSAPLATAAGCRACHLCRMQPGGGYNATNCIDQCNSCHLHDPFQKVENRLESSHHHQFQNNPGFGSRFSPEPMPPAKPKAPAAPQPVGS